MGEFRGQIGEKEKVGEFRYGAGEVGLYERKSDYIGNILLVEGCMTTNG